MAPGVGGNSHLSEKADSLQYRSSSRRHNRTVHNDHDVYEGLPVRQWRRETVTVAPSSAQDNITAQKLLRAARSGKIYKRSAPAEEEETDPEATHGTKLEKKEDPPQERGFTVRTWKQIPRHLEVPNVDFLARRRKDSTVRFETLSKSQPLTASKVISQKLEVVSGEPVQGFSVTHTHVDAETDSSHATKDVNGTIDGHAGIPTPLKRKGVFRKKMNVLGRSKRKKLLMTSCTAANNFGDSAAVVNSEQVPSLITVNNEDIEICGDSLANVDDWDGDDGEDADENENEIDVEEDYELTPNQASPSKIGLIPKIPIEQDHQESSLNSATEAILTVTSTVESNAVAELSPRMGFPKESLSHSIAQGLDNAEITQEIKQEITSNKNSSLILPENQSMIPKEVCTTTTISEKSIIFSTVDAKNIQSLTTVDVSTSKIEDPKNVDPAGSILEHPTPNSSNHSSISPAQNLAPCTKSEETSSEPMQGIEIEARDPQAVKEVSNDTSFPDLLGTEAPS
ncbi:Lyr-family protein [Blumeria hordei DH14]|uniref:Lyr-family protein n=1 Tax=Blumeria graminis f. sp. hordei (strain DH14) TaxID=546991 RepID=A0A078MYP4_BLUG1|nr:Lyr-family protein [Blumeria hordei DH14]